MRASCASPMWLAAVLCAACVDRGGAEPSDDRPATSETVDTDLPVRPVTSSPPWTATDGVGCAAPEARAAEPWTVVAGGDWDARGISGGAWGVFAADLDDDGWNDLVVPGGGGVRLYLGGPDGLVEATERMPPEVVDTVHRNAAGADVDDDGDLDVFVGGRGVDDYVLINDGWAHFHAQWLQVGATTMGGAFADVDGDHDLDLVVSNGTSQIEPALFLNDGAGRFEARPDMLPAEFPHGAAFVVSPIDLDGDLYPDLYRANDAGPGGPGNRLVWNDGKDGFVLDGGNAGLDVTICSMGLGIGDLNGDLIPDLAISDCRDLLLMKSNAAGVWVDHGDATGFGIDPPSGHDVPWGVELIDLDNDADLDAYVAYGYLGNAGFPNEQIQRDGVYLQGDDGRFTEVSEAWGVSTGQSRGFAVADLNNDGWLDVVKHDWYGKPQIYQSRCGAEAWLRIELDQGEGVRNRFGVGARIVVRTPGREQARWMTAGGTSVGSGGPAEVHVGLADAELADIEVRWPDGATGQWTDVPTRRIVTLYRE
jgi:enediyne biosynthesis protein E4